MNHPGDDVGGMGTTELPDEAIEAFFLGNAHDAWEGDEALVSLVDDVMTGASGPPPRPSAGLQVFLGEPSASNAPPQATPPPTAAPAWQPRTGAAPPASVDSGQNVVPLFRRLRLTAGIAAAAGVAAAALTVAGTTGVLPEPAMRAVSWVVEAVTPFELSVPDARSVDRREAPRPGPSSTVAPGPPATVAGPDPAGRVGAPGQPVPTTPAAVPPGTPPASIPAAPGSVRPPRTGIDPPGESPAGPSNPLVPAPQAGTLPPPAGGNATPPAAFDPGPQMRPGSSVPATVGSPPSRR